MLRTDELNLNFKIKERGRRSHFRYINSANIPLNVKGHVSCALTPDFIVGGTYSKAGTREHCDKRQAFQEEKGVGCTGLGRSTRNSTVRKKI